MTQDRPDVVSLHYVNVDSLALTWGRMPPAVMSIWGSDVLVELPESRMKRLLVGAALRRAALVVSPAGHVTEVLGRLGVEQEKVLTVQYGVDTDRFSPVSDARPAPVDVICTRAFRPVYGVEDIVRAAPLVPEAAVRRFLLVGDGPLMPELEQLAASLGVLGRVVFLGSRSHDELPGLLRDADVYCSMSRSDGSSLSLLEAMSCGLTPVVSDIPANREWVQDGVTGRIVAPGDVKGLAEALEATATNEAFRASAARAVRTEVVERGDRRANMARIVDAVEGLV